MQAAWGKAIAEPKADYAKIQEAWLKQLEEFVRQARRATTSPKCCCSCRWRASSTANNEAAEKWYRRLVADFGKSPNAAKAEGAILRLTSTGKTIPLKGTALQGAKSTSPSTAAR